VWLDSQKQSTETDKSHQSSKTEGRNEKQQKGKSLKWDQLLPAMQRLRVADRTFGRYKLRIETSLRDAIANKSSSQFVNFIKLILYEIYNGTLPIFR